MLAATYHGPGDLRLGDRDLPALFPGDVLVRVQAAGICGTDMRILHGSHRAYPEGTVRVPGHEFVGEIVDVGDGENGQLQGRVIVAPNWGCGHCRECIRGQNNRCAAFGAVGITIDGAFAEYVRIPAASVAQGNLIPLAAGADAATTTLTEPLACVVRGQNAVGGIRPDDIVLVMGAGPIGILHVMLARLRGARLVLVAETAPERLAQAGRAGADRLIDLRTQDAAATVRQCTGGQGADVIITAAPSGAAQQSALELAALGGRICYFGGLPREQSVVSLDTNLIHYKELQVTATSACSTADCWTAAAIVQAGRLDLRSLVSDHIPLRDAHSAFQAVEQRRGLKVVLEP